MTAEGSSKPVWPLPQRLAARLLLSSPSDRDFAFQFPAANVLQTDMAEVSEQCVSQELMSSDKGSLTSHTV